MTRTKGSQGEGWVLFADIYGFRGLLSDANFALTIETLERYVDKLDIFLTKSQRLQTFDYVIFSDLITIFVPSAKGDQKSLQLVVNICQTIMNIAANHNFLLRGAMTFGFATPGKTFILGEAYMRAYRLESNSIYIPVIVIPEEDLDSSGLLNYYRQDLGFTETKDGNRLNGLILDSAPFDRVEQISQFHIANLSKLPEDHVKQTKRDLSPLEIWKSIWSEARERRMSRKGARGKDV